MKKPKKPPTIESQIIGKLRNLSYRWKPRNECLKAASVDLATSRCEHCKNIIYHGKRPFEKVIYLQKLKDLGEVVRVGEIKADHILPIVPPSGFKNGKAWDWNEYIGNTEEFPNGMFSCRENWQALCKECHDLKSNIERGIRAKVKKEKK